MVYLVGGKWKDRKSRTGDTLIVWLEQGYQGDQVTSMTNDHCAQGDQVDLGDQGDPCV